VRVQSLFGLRFVDDPSIDAVAATVLAERPADVTGWRVVVTPNVDHLIRYDKNPVDRLVAEQASLVLPDGSPVVWASRLVGRRLRARLTGADLFAAIWPQLVAQQRAVVAVAANETVAGALRADHPRVHCIVPPMFDAGDAETIRSLAEQIHAAVTATGAEVVLIGVAMPKHHRVCAALTALDAPPATPWVLLLGAAAEFHVGIQRRAPQWMQRYGLEWLYRLLRDPRKMARRYLIDDPAFVLLVWRELRAGRRERAAARHA
jgi:N-acetylglucosaminyldiphosphoundecaprenol N-acetyl-beta-D-mannosaminyltransferase